MQLDIFADTRPPITAPNTITGTIHEKFLYFHHQNPHVYQRLKKEAFRLKNSGARRWGMKGLFEVLRWQSMIKTRDVDGLKLNNNFTSLYARLLMEKEPALEGFFEIRERVGE